MTGRSRDDIAAHLRPASQPDKPAVLKGFGFMRDDGGYGTDVPTSFREPPIMQPSASSVVS